MPFMFMHGWGWGWWWFPFHGLISLVVLVLVIVLLARAFRAPHAYVGHGRSAALDMLEQRYARGEIQREEYLEKKKDLGG